MNLSLSVCQLSANLVRLNADENMNAFVFNKVLTLHTIICGKRTVSSPVFGTLHPIQST
jgi:hypothetical protein